VFRFVPRQVSAVTTDARTAVEKAARELLQALTDLPTPPTLRVADAAGQVACLIQVWDTSLLMPTGAERRKRALQGRAECKEDIVEVVKVAGQALTRKEIIRALTSAGKNHGPSATAKALADLTAAGELVSPKDKKGYRLAEWRRNKTPSLFD
jgi:hypothetical protein